MSQRHKLLMIYDEQLHLITMFNCIYVYSISERNYRTISALTSIALFAKIQQRWLNINKNPKIIKEICL